MKDLLSKDHYCYKIYTLLIKAIAYSPRLWSKPLYGVPPIFTGKIFIPPIILLKFSNSPINNGGSHYDCRYTTRVLVFFVFLMFQSWINSSDFTIFKAASKMTQTRKLQCVICSSYDKQLKTCLYIFYVLQIAIWKCLILMVINSILNTSQRNWVSNCNDLLSFDIILLSLYPSNELQL